MAFSFKVQNGDLVSDGSRLAIVTGVDKLTQELSIWLTEKFQSDRFHPRYGSVLDNFIGGVIDHTTELKIRSEIMRVINNYIMIKMQSYRDDPTRFTDDEMLDRILDVKIRQDYDSIYATISFVTIAQSQGRIIQQVRA